MHLTEALTRGRTLFSSSLILALALGVRAWSGAWSPSPPQTPELPAALGASSLSARATVERPPVAVELDSSLFCRDCGDELGAPPLAPTSLPLQLLATLEANDPAESMATVVNLRSSAVAAYLPGEELLPGVRLESVRRGRAYLRRGEELEVLSIEATPAKVQADAAATPPKVECGGEGPCRLSRQWLRALLERPKELAKQARIVPVHSDGELQGYKVYGVRPRSVWARLGVESGDMVESVNGVHLDELDALMGLYGQLETRSEWRVVVVRRGERLDRRFLLE